MKGAVVLCIIALAVLMYIAPNKKQSQNVEIEEIEEKEIEEIYWEQK